MNIYQGKEQELEPINPLTKKQEKEALRLLEDIQDGTVKLKGFEKKS